MSLLDHLLQEQLLVLIRHFITGETWIEESSLQPGFCMDLSNDEFLHWLGKLVQLTSCSVATDVVYQCLTENRTQVLDGIVDGTL